MKLPDSGNITRNRLY